MPLFKKYIYIFLKNRVILKNQLFFINLHVAVPPPQVSCHRWYPVVKGTQNQTLPFKDFGVMPSLHVHGRFNQETRAYRIRLILYSPEHQTRKSSSNNHRNTALAVSHWTDRCAALEINTTLNSFSQLWGRKSLLHFKIWPTTNPGLKI